MGKRIAYVLAGYGVGCLILVTLWAFTWKFRVWSVLMLGSSFGNLFVCWAQRKGKLKTIEELNRPLTLVPRER